MFKVLQQIWHSKDLRKKILFTLAIIAVYRFMTHITIPEVNKEALQYVFDKNSLLGAFSLLTGGSAENFSIVLMGLSPYINASIIMQMLGMVVPKLEELQKEGDYGRQKINQYTRWFSIPLAFLQSYGMIMLLRSQGQGLMGSVTPFELFTVVLITSAGTVLLMWLGGLITERGIGNGISLIITLGIVSRLPSIVQSVGASYTGLSSLLPVVGLVVLSLIVISSIIFLSSTMTNFIEKISPAIGAYCEELIDSIISLQSGFFEENFLTLFQKI